MISLLFNAPVDVSKSNLRRDLNSIELEPKWPQSERIRIPAKTLLRTTTQQPNPAHPGQRARRAGESNKGEATPNKAGQAVKVKNLFAVELMGADPAGSLRPRFQKLKLVVSRDKVGDVEESECDHGCVERCPMLEGHPTSHEPYEN